MAGLGDERTLVFARYLTRRNGPSAFEAESPQGELSQKRRPSKSAGCAVLLVMLIKKATSNVRASVAG